MTTIWWAISQEARIALANYQSSQHKDRLDAIYEKPPEAVVEYPAELEPEVDPELVRDMQQRQPGHRAT